MDKIILFIISIIHDIRRLMSPFICHVFISWSGWLPQLHFYSHEKLIEVKENEYNKIAISLSRLDFMKFVLSEYKSYHYLIFEMKLNETIFVQFHFDQHSFLLDFPATDYNGYFPKLDRVVKLLEKEGFEFRKNMLPYEKIQKLQYSRFKAKWGEGINADCGTDIDLAASMGDKIFSNIFHENGKVVVKLG